MKAKLLVVLTLLGSVLFSSCEEVQEPNVNPEYVTVSLGFGGELDLQYEPLTKVSTDDLYGIDVYSVPENENVSTKTTFYMGGLFDDPSAISIELMKGYKYNFEATIIKDGKNRICTIKGVDSEISYWDPFNCTLKNEFTFYCANAFNSYITPAGSDGIYTHANVERYVGALDLFSPSEDNSTAKLSMLRANFGAKFVVEGNQANNGILRINLGGAPKMEINLSKGEREISDMFTFEGTSNIVDKNGIDYSETISLQLMWDKEDGSTSTLGTHYITFKRNLTTVVTIKLEEEEEDNVAGVAFEIAEEEQGEMPENSEGAVLIENGVIVVE